MEKLTQLRARMKTSGFDAYIVTGADAHSSGYVPAYWKTRTWLTGFTGSNGLAVVTRNKAGLWTDGRYFIQAENELSGSGFALYKMEEPGVPTYQAFLKEELPQGGRVGFDGRTLTVQSFDTLRKLLADKEIVYDFSLDLVGAGWAERPALPAEPVFEHKVEYTGKTAQEKLALVREQMAKKNITGYIVTALDDIAWLANIRGGDVPYTPLVYAYAYITPQQAYLFINPAKVQHIALQDFTLMPYEQFSDFIGGIRAADLHNGKLFFNPNKTNVVTSEALQKSLPLNRNTADDIILLMKAVKNETELANSRTAYINEGTVWVKLLMWLEETFATEDFTLCEGDITRKLKQLRAERFPEYYLHDGFSTIAAYGGNAASAHYNPGENGAEIKREGFLLIDSGAQYLNGTTDTTRTIPVGPLTEEMRRDYTLVLKGHIALALAEFPAGTTGSQIDILARMHLYKDGKNFRHGTGHGIGYVLGVHEGPQNIAHRPSTVALLPGMFLSNEPGMYKENEYGIRTENIIFVKELRKTEYGTFLGFEPLTRCPINTSAVDFTLLTDDERAYVNAYHQTVYNDLAPLLKVRERQWLKNAVKEV
jgi:Xaa-Pro aminopeptidase